MAGMVGNPARVGRQSGLSIIPSFIGDDSKRFNLLVDLVCSEARRGLVLTCRTLEGRYRLSILDASGVNRIAQNSVQEMLVPGQPPRVPQPAAWGGDAFLIERLANLIGAQARDKVAIDALDYDLLHRIDCSHLVLATVRVAVARPSGGAIIFGRLVRTRQLVPIGHPTHHTTALSACSVTTPYSVPMLDTLLFRHGCPDGQIQP